MSKIQHRNLRALWTSLTARERELAAEHVARHLSLNATAD